MTTTMPAEMAAELTQAADDLVQRELARPEVRAAARGQGWSADLWAATAAAGWFDVLVRDEHGGLGLGLEAAAGLFTVIGRRLVPGPYLDHIAMVPMMYAHASASVRSRLDRARAGQELIVLADPAATGRQGALLADGSLTGRACLVRHGCTADGFVVIARDPACGVAVAFVDAQAPGVTTVPRDSFDSASVVADVQFDRVAVPDDFVIPAPATEIDFFRGVLRLMAAAELTGLARHLLDASVRYAKIREQFGRPIGSFQAIQQILAELAAQVLGAEAFTRECAAQCELDRGESALMDTIALKGFASHVDRLVGESALQVHGGIAFTEEFDDNRWFLRALTLQGLYGDEAASFGEVGRTLLAPPAVSRENRKSLGGTYGGNSTLAHLPVYRPRAPVTAVIANRLVTRAVTAPPLRSRTEHRERQPRQGNSHAEN
jgi:alkylation response protein AidB-like acyl-CoA dehydrogenase